VSRTVHQKSLRYHLSYPTSLFGPTLASPSEVTIFSMPLYVICPLPTPTRTPRHLGSYSPTRRMDAPARTHMRIRIDLWLLATFAPFLGVQYHYQFCCHHHPLFDCNCDHTATPAAHCSKVFNLSSFTRARASTYRAGHSPIHPVAIKHPTYLSSLR
jgi:hypothetical protein